MTLNPIVTLRRTMTRLLACLLAAAVVAGCSLAAAPRGPTRQCSLASATRTRACSRTRCSRSSASSGALLPVVERGAEGPRERRAGWTTGFARPQSHQHRAADLVLRRARLEVPEAALQAPDGARVHEGLQSLPNAVAGREGDQPLERGEPPLAADLQEPEAGGAVLQRGASTAAAARSSRRT